MIETPDMIDGLVGGFPRSILKALPLKHSKA
jgi:hypothetical protein